MQSQEKLDVLTIGRSGVDIYPLQVGVGLEDVTSFGEFLGGSPMNVAVAAARLGESRSILTGVGDDPFGRYVRAEMRRLGASDEYVVVTTRLNTPVTFCEIFPPDDFPIHGYREPSAPDLQITTADVPEGAVRTVRILCLSVIGLSEEPSLSAHRRGPDTAVDAVGLADALRDADWQDEHQEHERRWFTPLITIAVTLVGYLVVNFGLAYPMMRGWFGEPIAEAASSTVNLNQNAVWVFLRYGFVAVALVIVPLQCAVEEFLFRGYLLKAFGGWGMRAIPAALTSTVLFTASHAYELAGLSVVFVLGLTLSFITIRTGGIEGSFAFHTVNNLSTALAGALMIVDGLSDAHVTLPIFMGYTVRCIITALIMAWWLRRTALRNGDRLVVAR